MIGTKIGTLAATTTDPRPVWVYSLSGTDANTFVVNSGTGEILLAKPLDVTRIQVSCYLN
ncbi:unnamed protein product [Protopolystoma xenopodis]|uniref:Cadherin domain-containing protein n=1 Tax=Protopolystoma xenopodis TaxID=117903 RepID=A0A3S5BB14_9PLAT|nr:unnamed protein product [Protopolystoma xenopodis]